MRGNKMAINHTIRNSEGGLTTVSLTPIRAIRKFCVECFGFSVYEVARCTSPNCPLFPYRLGKRADADGTTEETED
jgi:hypothetical protein